MNYRQLENTNAYSLHNSRTHPKKKHTHRKIGGKTESIRMIKKKLHLSWKAEGGKGSLWEFK